MLALATVPAYAWAASPSEAVRPNILLIVSEDHGPELGCYGDSLARTPVLDQLAADGMRFERAHVVQAGCSPSRASLHTGLYPHRHGQVGLATWGFRLHSDTIPTLPAVLKEGGYRTGIIGKLHVLPETAFPFDFTALPTSNFARKDMADYAREAGAFMKASADPFFLAVNYPDAHSPWPRQADGLPADPFDPEDVPMLPYFGVDTPALRAVLANHYNSIMRLDTLVGELLAQLEASGKAGETVVIFMSDHGPDLIRGKRTVYQGGLHIPLIIRWPGVIASGSTSRALVESVDLMPTILEAAGSAPVAAVHGVSLMPLLRGQPVSWRQYLYAEYHTHAAAPNFNPQRALRDDRFKLIENLCPGEVNPNFTFTFNPKRYGYDSAAIAAAEAAPHIRETYERMRIQPRYELYDLSTDPNEFHNLATDAAFASDFRRLVRALEAMRHELGDPLLDASILATFREEVLGVTDPKEARRHPWQYPHYFFPKPEAE